ncbi:ROK family transcriptional regulator [Glycomyces luteolus]|uniref:ROK family transcriptional regulator n=1 Tax=Glycomyces luteolus TaxID=2670330 RepID=A0A9X3SRA8_9ACTN|nr:ROK family transcriptional regulator [Glycomyces luteolus]MDA1361437.1 ROK family transcriptional regulator [Glycomyces luteolus]
MSGTRLTSRDIRSESRLVVMRALLAAGESTRSDLAEATGLSLGTVSTIVQDLLKFGIIAESGQLSSGIGRPTTGLRLNADRGRVVGVYVEDRYLEATVFDAALGELATVEAASDAAVAEADEVIAWIDRTLETALERAQAKREDVIGVGILLPGGMQRPVKGATAPDAIWLHFDRLLDTLGLPVVVDNPLKAIATAELWLGAGRRVASAVAVSLGYGVGAGIIQDGAVVRGATNAAGEWGHSLLVFDGRQCQCGRKGCVEAYVGIPGLRTTLAEIAPGHPLAEGVDALGEGPEGFDLVAALADAAKNGDRAAIATMERSAHYLGAALTDLVAILNPEVIALRGWAEWPVWRERIAPIVRRRVLEDSPGDAAAGLAIELSPTCGMEGIAAIALERFMRDIGLVTTREIPAL